MPFGQEDWWKGFQSKNGANALIGLGTGLLSGNTFAKGLAAGGQGYLQGAQVDQQYADEAEKKAKEAQGLNSTLEYMRSKGYDDLVGGVEGGGLDMQTAWSEALKRGAPGYGQSAPIKVGAGETLLDPNSFQPVYQGAPDPKDAAAAVQNQFGNEKDLFAQYAGSDTVKAYETVKSGYERVRQSSALQSGAGDMGLIYGYMKMLDPGSVVRESEFSMAAQAGSYGEQIQGMVQRVIDGQRLPESVRQQFVQAADGIYKDTAANLGDINSQFSTRASRYHVDPSTFVRQPEIYKPIDGIVTMPNGNTIRQVQ